METPEAMEQAMRSLAGKRLTAALTVAVLLVVPSSCGGGGTAGSTKLDAGEIKPAKPAPEIALRNWNGRPLRLAQYRGKAVLLTFIYDHCPDTCPLIVSKLHTALTELGTQASDVRVVAVSVDPKGDTPTTVKRFLREHLMLGRMDYLIGTKKQLEPVWKAYGIAVEASPDTRENSSRVGHTALIYGVTGSGKILALYDSLVKPREIAHDAPLLALR
jgi:protein SCO1/2